MLATRRCGKFFIKNKLYQPPFLKLSSYLHQWIFEERCFPPGEQVIPHHFEALLDPNSIQSTGRDCFGEHVGIMRYLFKWSISRLSGNRQQEEFESLINCPTLLLAIS